MRKDHFLYHLASGCERLAIDLDGKVADALFVYFQELKKWNLRINLLAKSTSDEQILELHFLDSLTLLTVLQHREGHLLDIGTGAGLPGLVYAVAKKEETISLVEPRKKRCVFLNHLRRKLELQKVVVYPCRIEEDMLSDDFEFDYVTSRAVTDMGALINMVQRFKCRMNAEMICMKGPRWQEEIEELRTKYRLGLKKYDVKEMVLPFSKANRALISFQLADVINVE